MFKTAVLSTLALAASVCGSAAAPFDYSKEVFAERRDVAVDYTLDQETLLAEPDRPFEFFGDDGLKGFSLDGTLDAGAGAGFLTLTRRNGYREVYSAEILGSLGQEYFTEDYVELAQRLKFFSVPIPDLRINLTPLGGRDLDALFPNGFSLQTPCDYDPWACDSRELPPVSNLSETNDPDFPVEYDFQYSPVEITPIPVPAALGLSGLALGCLGWVGRRRRA